MLKKMVVYLKNGSYDILGYNTDDEIEYCLTEKDSGILNEAIYIGRVSHINYKNGSAFIDIGVATGFINLKQQHRLQMGSTLICQIRHFAEADKYIKLSLSPTIVGRYVILIEEVKHIFYCNKLQHQKIHKIAVKYVHLGIIFRTSTNDVENVNLIEAEIIYLQEKLAKIAKNRVSNSAISCIYDGLPVYLKLIRDSKLSEDFQVISNDNKVFDTVLPYIDLWQIDQLHLQDNYLINHIELCQLEAKPTVLSYTNFGLELNSLSGIKLIDVNSKNAQLSFFQVNYLAIEEIVRQIKLRDLTGIILLDLIKNMSIAEKQKITDKLISLMSNDWRNNKVLGFTRAGIFEIIRNR